MCKWFIKAYGTRRSDRSEDLNVIFTEKGLMEEQELVFLTKDAAKLISI